MENLNRILTSTMNQMLPTWREICTLIILGAGDRLYLRVGVKKDT
jgi:hypothetical protein